MRKINSIIIHCSDSIWGDAGIIRYWHTSKGWKDIGYHYCILNGKRKNELYSIADDGLIEPGRHLDNDANLEKSEVGAHCYGNNNNSIGICLIGQVLFTPKQFESLAYLVLHYKKMIPDICIFGHYEFNSNKTCPNIEMNGFRSFINNVTIMHDISHYFEKYF